jgi:hypothetical protein
LKLCHTPIGQGPARGVPISPGIIFLMYRIDRLVVLVYIRQPLQHRGGAMRGVWRGVFRGIGVGLSRILDVNFREYLF